MMTSGRWNPPTEPGDVGHWTAETDWDKWHKIDPKKLDDVHGVVRPATQDQPKYLVAADLRYYEDKLGSCKCCEWVYRRITEGGVDFPGNWTIWVTGCREPSRVTGIPHEFEVYIQSKSRKAGHKAVWNNLCWDHAYLAYLDIQQIMLDELHDWDLTDRWMQNRNGRI
jgi:hypothetical protein